MKKGYALFSLLLIGIIVSSYIVSAADIGQQVTNVIDKVVQFINPIAKYLLGETTSGELLLAKVIFLLIILAIVWTALNNIEFFSENTWVLVIVSLGSAILATRWLTESIIRTILLPYTTIGIAVSAGVPFVVYFILVNVGFKNQPAIVRRIAWIFFAVIFAGLWIARGTQIAGKSSWIYPITALLAFVMALIDGTIQGFFNKMQEERAAVGRKGAALRILQKELADITTNYNNLGESYRGTTHSGTGKSGTDAYLKDVADVEARIRKLLKSK